MLQNFFILSFSFLYAIFNAPQTPHFKEANPFLKAANENEEIVVFTQKSDKLFLENTLPKLQEMCKEKNIKLIEKNASEGLPNDISTTPAIIFQNYKGRSIFSGRYTEWTSIMNFVRTSRFLPQGKIEKDCRDTVFACRKGRTTLFSVLKITPLTGELPNNFKQKDFLANAKRSVEKSLGQFKNEGLVCKLKTDRAFYLDMYPYRDKKGMYYLSIALFSQFNCITPIFEQKDLQSTDFQSLIRQGTAILEKEIFSQLQNSLQGDALSFVPNETPNLSWESLNLNLPKAPLNVTPNKALANKEMPLKWKYMGIQNEDIPVLQFHFLAPLDRYVGEIKTMKGAMLLSDNQHIKEGIFETEMLSLTMGIADFDHKIQSKYIKANKYPTARFRFQNIRFPNPLQLWQTQTFPIEGELSFMDKTENLKVMATFTPIIAENGNMRLEISANFNLNIAYYEIKGPDGPKNAAENMAFLMNFQLNSI